MSKTAERPLSTRNHTRHRTLDGIRLAEARAIIRSTSTRNLRVGSN